MNKIFLTLFQAQRNPQIVKFLIHYYFFQSRMYESKSQNWIYTNKNQLSLQNQMKKNSYNLLLLIPNLSAHCQNFEFLSRATLLLG